MTFPLHFSLLAIAILSTLLFGSVEPWSIAVVGIITAIVFIDFIRKFKGLSEKDVFSKHIVLASGIVFALGLFQLVPLPVSFLNLIHPKLSYLFAIPPAVTTGGMDPPLSVPGSMAVANTPIFHALSVYPFATEMGLARLIIYLMVFLLAAFGLQTKKEVYSVMKGLAVFGFALALLGVIQKAFWDGRIYWFRTLSNPRSQPFASFVNKNHFACWINMVIPVSLGIGLMAKTIQKKVRYLFFGVAMSVIMFYSLSRGGVMSLFAGIFVFIFVMLNNRVPKKRLIPFFLFILALGIFLAYVGIMPLMQRFAQIDITTEERIVIWKATLGAFLDFPVFGSGLGTYSHIFKMYHPPTWWVYDYAHNDYLQFLLEAGCAGAVIAGLFIFAVFHMVYKSEWTEREAFLKAAFFSSAATIACHSIFDFSLHVPSNAILFSLILGLAVALGRLNSDFEE